MSPYISARPLRESERHRTPSIEESVRAVKAHADRRRARKNWQPKKDPDNFYRRQGLPSEAQASSETAFKRYDPHGND